MTEVMVNLSGPMRMQGINKETVRAEIQSGTINGQFFLRQNINSDRYLKMFQEITFPHLINGNSKFLVYLHQYGTTCHFGIHVWKGLDQKFLAELLDNFFLVKIYFRHQS